MPHAKYYFGARGTRAASAHAVCPNLRRSSKCVHSVLSANSTRGMLSACYGVYIIYIGGGFIGENNTIAFKL